jgi:poly(3-hydroxybutyrate) depolymerase
MMVERLGCDAAGSFAAIAAVEGDLMDASKCSPAPAKQVS